MDRQDYTLYDIELENSQAGFHFFDPSAKRFFSSRILQDVYQGPGGIFFITSEQFDTSSPRLYSVRQFFPDTKRIKTCGKFQGYRTTSAAKREAKRLAEQKGDQT